MLILTVRIFIGSVCLYYIILNFQSCKNSCWISLFLMTLNKILQTALFLCNLLKFYNIKTSLHEVLMLHL